MRYKLSLISVFLILQCFNILYAQQNDMTQIFVAPSGNDDNPGTIELPLQSLQKAQELVSAGDTVYVRGGLYQIEESQISQVVQGLFACITLLEKSGTDGNTIKYWAYPGETPTFDFSNVKPQDRRVVGIYVVGSYIHIKGFEMTGIQTTIKEHTESYCIYSRGNNNIYEQISMHDNVGTGLRHYRGGGNLFLNCDSYRNWDTVSEDGLGSNNDGFGCHPSVGSTGNIFKGCRAWFNSDDGFDIIRSGEAVIFDSCWAFYNGYSTLFKSLGDGNGFKAGGHAYDSNEKLPEIIPRHTIRFCVAVRNKANGFYSNHHLGGNDWFNNTGYRNSAKDFNMLNRPSREDAENIDGPGYDHVLKNNLAAAQYGDGTAYIVDSLNTQETNTWNLGIHIVSDDFLSSDMDQLTAPRDEFGNLPNIDFLKPVGSSPIVDAGVDIGFPYLDNAPDLGAFEVDKTTAIDDFEGNLPNSIELYQNCPNPFNPTTRINYSVGKTGVVTIELYNSLGQKVKTLVKGKKVAGNYSVTFDAHDFSSGVYFYSIKADDFRQTRKMLLIK